MKTTHKHAAHRSNGCDACLDLWFALPVGRPIVLPNRWREHGEPYLPGACPLHGGPGGASCQCKH